MLPYIAKRLLLFVPTLFLVSCVAFSLKNNVDSDPVETLLRLQGIDEEKEGYSKLYEAKIQEMNLDLPNFYVGVHHSYTAWVSDLEGSIQEKRFAHDLASKKHKETEIKELLESFSLLDDKSQRRLLLCQSPLEVIDRINSSQFTELEHTIKEKIVNIASAMMGNQVTWFYPIVRWNGLHNQYHNWMKDLMVGDFGVSLLDARPVFNKIWDSLRWTLVLVVLGLFIALIISFVLGIYNGMHKDSRFDTWSNAILFLIYSIPKFWLATMLIIFFTTKEYGGWTDIFPNPGLWGSMNDGFLSMILSSLDKLILPIMVVVIPDVAYLSRLIRAGIIEENSKEYIKTARSKGVPSNLILWKHLVPNSLTPTITLMAGVIPSALGASLIIEVIFNIPGVGRLLFDSIRVADWAVVFPIVFIVCIITVIFFLIADILVAWLNPKIKFG